MMARIKPPFALLTILKKTGEWATIGFGFLCGIVIAGYLVGALTILLFHTLAPKFPLEAITPPAHNIADWRSLVVIAIGCLAILCFFLIRSLVSQPLGKLIENSFAKWDTVVARSPSAAWVAQFILPKPSPEEIRAASVWKQRSDDFDKRIFAKAYLGSYEADEHEIIKHKKSLRSYPRLKRAGKIRAWFLGTPIVLLVAYFFLFVSPERTEDTDDASGTDNQEGVAVETASPQSVQNSTSRQWCWDVALLCSALGFPVWIVSSLSEKRYLRLLGADTRPEEGDDEIYVADPTSFESWRQAFIDHHGHDMSAEQEKKLRAGVDKVIEADEQARGAAAAALRKVSEKIDEITS